ncbi:MAG: hypothetical protein O7B25_05270 [Gammaproteobacteria bacterium]|nr:hypothetical protein [Gammaproteobacteria bacterium]
MNDDDLKRARDDARCEAGVLTVKDVLWRFEELNEGTHTMYDLLGYVVEDLVREGCCAACISETLAAAFKEVGADPDEHRGDGDTVH